MPAPKKLDPSASLTALYGAKLRKLRLRAGWTQRELGARVHLAHSRIAQFELGKETPAEEISQALDAVLKADGDLHDLWTHARRTPFPDWARKLVEYQTKATAIHHYTAHVIPGLLQTRAYALELLRFGMPWCRDTELEEQVAARLNRQRLLQRPSPPLLWVILDEAVLRRPVGGPAVMREQLAQVLACSEQPHIQVQVLPFSAGTHSALGGSLMLLSFEKTGDVAYLEGAASGELVEDSTRVAQHSYRFDIVQSLALPPAASTVLIREAMESYST